MSDGDGYTFEPEAAKQVEKGLRDAIAELKELGFDHQAQLGMGFSDLELSHKQAGHAGLQQAFDTFTERWGWGIRGKIQDANTIASALGLSAGLYHEQEQYVKDTLKVAVASGMADPTMTEGELKDRSWGETLKDNHFSHVANPEFEAPSWDELGEPWGQVGEDWSTSPWSPGLGQDTDMQWDGGPSAEDSPTGDGENGEASR